MIFGLLAALMLTFSVMGLVFYLVVITILGFVAYRLQLAGQIASYVRSSAIFAIIIFAVYLVFTRNVVQSTFIVERLIIFIQLFSLLSLTTSPEDIATALIKAGFPYSFALAFTMAVRFIPTVALELKAIEDSQRARGLELDKGNLLERIKKYVPILIPLLANTILKVDNVAEAMESKCFGTTRKPTRLVELKMKASDWLILFFGATWLVSYLVYYSIYHHPLILL
jgi:energy-coupling factor transport system permease protein